jgi:hypothetical protein
MRIALSALAVCLSFAAVAAAPRKVSAVGSTVMAPDGWTDMTTGEEISLVYGDGDVAFRISLVPSVADRFAKAVKDAKDCATFSVEFAATMGIEGAKGKLTTIGGRAMCEVTGTLSGTNVAAELFPVGKTAAVALCIATTKNPDKKRHDECRAMAASFALDPKAKPAKAAAYTTSKQPKGVTRVTAGNAQLDVPAGWTVTNGTAGQLFAANKNKTILSVTRVNRAFKGDTEANCKKLATDAGQQQGAASSDGRMLQLRAGKACLVSIDTKAGTTVTTFVNAPGGAEHVLVSCTSVNREEAVMKECGVALGSLTFQ